MAALHCFSFYILREREQTLEKSFFPSKFSQNHFIKYKNFYNYRYVFLTFKQYDVKKFNYFQISYIFITDIFT